MAEVAKKRAMRVWSMNTGKREPLFDGVKIEEKWQSALESPTGISLRRGIPVLAVCLFAGQGKLSGGAMPFAPTLLAGAMMCGRSVGYAAAGCAVGALLAGSPGTALACALLLLLWVILRCLNLTPNDLTCVAAAGIVSYALPALYAVTMQDQLTAAVGAVTAAVLARLYAAALRVKLNGRELLSPEEIISLSLLAAGVLTGFRSMEICGVSPVISALLLLNLGAGYLGGVGIGAAVGALTGLMLGVTQPVQPYLCVGLALSGLLPGLFSPLGRWGAAAALPVALVLAEGFPRQLIAIFGAANESSYYTDFAIKAFRTYLCMMILACVNKACFIFLQAVGKALSSTLLSMFREMVFGVGFALLLPVFFGLDGVLYSMPVSDILTFIISAVIIVKTYRELNAERVQSA